MPFDLGFNFRGTSGYVTDGSEGVPVLGETYPHTYTASNGYSSNAGWDIAPTIGDRNNAFDPRIAGDNFQTNGGTVLTFTVDLSSGSAPGAGTYTVDLASGQTWAASHQYTTLKDNATLLIDLAGTANAANHFIDATVADNTGSATWAGATTSVTFATTTAKLTIGGGSGSDWTAMAHFRLTLQGGGTNTDITPPTAVRLGL